MTNEHTLNCTCADCTAARQHAENGATKQQEHTHDETCNCGHSHTATQEGGHSHAGSCECGGSHAHEHDHGDSCSCGSNDEHAHDDGCGCGHEHTGGYRKYPVQLIVGIVLFAAAIILSTALSLPQWGSFIAFAVAYIVLGANVLKAAGKNILRGKIFDENFLMTVATIGAFVLGEYMEGTAVMLFYLIGETLSDMAVEKSRRSITELMDIRPDYANIEVDGATQQVSPDSISIGDVILIKPYEKVPLDAVVIDGASTLNTSALTGESLPRDIAPGDEILAGCINGANLVRARTIRTYGESTAAKILDVVENASNRKAHTEKFITRFARYYTPIVCAIALIVAVVPSLVTGLWDVWVYRALLFLVISCPCALVVAIPLSFFSGIGGISKQGILVKGANYVEALTNVSAVIFDKTGTLTKGVFEVQQIVPQDGVSKEELLALAAAAESNSSHPIAKSIQKANGSVPDLEDIQDYQDIAGYGVSVQYRGAHILAGSARLMNREKINFTEPKQSGTVLYVARDGQYIGHILIADTLKEDAIAAIAQLKQMGIHTAMLTGDTQSIAQEIAQQAGLDEVKAELLPQDKVAALEQIAERQTGTAFVGDGINDAPVLARADVGIAMGALGSDAAIEAADVVLMTDEPTSVATAIRASKKTKRIVYQNIVLALGIKTVVMILGVVGLANMWAAVFADVGVTLLAILNALRALRVPK